MPVTLVIKRRFAGAAGGGTAEGGEPDLPAVSFDGPRVVIGRSGSCDLRIPDASVSGRHASIRADGAQWTVVDEGSNAAAPSSATGADGRTISGWRGSGEDEAGVIARNSSFIAPPGAVPPCYGGSSRVGSAPFISTAFTRGGH